MKFKNLSKKSLTTTVRMHHDSEEDMEVSLKGRHVRSLLSNGSKLQVCAQTHVHVYPQVNTDTHAFRARRRERERGKETEGETEEEHEIHAATP